MASKLCNVAEFYKKLAAFFRGIGQTRLADTLEKVYEFLSKIGNCEPLTPAIRAKLKAVADRADEPIEMVDVAAALDLAKSLAEAISAR